MVIQTEMPRFMKQRDKQLSTVDVSAGQLDKKRDLQILYNKYIPPLSLGIFIKCFCAFCADLEGTWEKSDIFNSQHEVLKISLVWTPPIPGKNYPSPL